MIHFFELLSGDMPGGFVLLMLFLLFANLTLYFLLNSGLISIKNVWKKRTVLNIAIIAAYILIWIYTKNPTPPDRIVVLPTVSEGKEFTLNTQSLKLAELFENNQNLLKGRFVFHRWCWLYETLGDEQTEKYDNWLNTGKELLPYILIKSIYQNSGELRVQIVFSDSKNSSKEIVFLNSPWEEVLKKVLIESDLQVKSEPFVVDTNDTHLNAKLLIMQRKFSEVQNLLTGDTTITARILLAESFIKKGLTFKYNYTKAKYVSTENPDFNRAKTILHNLVKKKIDQTPVALLLGRMAIREQEFENAEVYLKKAFIDEPVNARVYYLFSLLLPSRLEELGFENRKDVLNKAIQLDPGYTDAVYDLANEYYITGTGSEGGTGTQFALKTLEKYLLINKSDPKILSLLATLYIKTSRFEDAEKIYNDLGERYPDDSNVQYNLGIVNYAKGDYKTALDFFKMAIKKDQNVDAYLYAGISYEMMGDKDNALKFYQDRVRLKTGDDDVYAKEAMAGIRKIREEMELNEKGKSE